MIHTECSLWYPIPLLNIPLSPNLSVVLLGKLFPSGFPTKSLHVFPTSPCMTHKLPRYAVQVITFLIKQFSPGTCYVRPFRPQKVSSATLPSNTLSPMFLSNTTDHVLHPYTTTEVTTHAALQSFIPYFLLMTFNSSVGNDELQIAKSNFLRSIILIWK
jgi:hypothetical protein